MNRNRWVAMLSLLLIANVSYYVWRNWGLITVDSDDRPLGDIVRMVSKQGHVVVRSELDPATPVRMHVHKVPLAEALETLAAVTDARWRLQYLLGPDARTVAGAADSLSAGANLEGWKTLFYPLPPTGEESGVPVDPRRDVWDVKAPGEATLQNYLEGAARSVSASFAVPETWNPAISSAPGSGQIGSVAPKLAKAAKGRLQELFLLTKRNRERGERPPDEGPGTPSEGGRFGGMNREAMEERMTAEIAKLPPEKRAAAQAEMEERRTFFASMRDLKPEERRAKMEEFMERPEVQDRMDKRNADRDARRTPAQRLQRAQKYRERKQQSLGAK